MLEYIISSIFSMLKLLLLPCPPLKKKEYNVRMSMDVDADVLASAYKLN